MVELSALYNLDVYTTRGKYVGRIQDVILNIKKGRVSTLKAVAMNPDKKNVGIRDVIKTTINIVPSERDEIRPLQEEGSIDIPYERVQAVGDILLISPEIVSEAAATSAVTQ
ncbi:MAG: PRC-barrel domain-containing protein [Methanobacterium sp.]|jgi:sporulation protein YlmC with PRC-barrel domain|nr:PRC-barrel domain-containing protein [Methanobacterium sp.]